MKSFGGSSVTKASSASSCETSRGESSGWSSPSDSERGGSGCKDVPHPVRVGPVPRDQDVTRPGRVRIERCLVGPPRCPPDVGDNGVLPLAYLARVEDPFVDLGQPSWVRHPSPPSCDSPIYDKRSLQAAPHGQCAAVCVAGSLRSRHGHLRTHPEVAGDSGLRGPDAERRRPQQDPRGGAVDGKLEEPPELVLRGRERPGAEEPPGGGG